MVTHSHSSNGDVEVVQLRPSGGASVQVAQLEKVIQALQIIQQGDDTAVTSC